MITKSEIKKQIESTEIEYQRCWEILSNFKAYDLQKITAEDLFNFQPILAKSLFRLSEFYRSLHQEKKGIIGKKDVLSKEWYIHRLQLIREYQDLIKH